MGDKFRVMSSVSENEDPKSIVEHLGAALWEDPLAETRTLRGHLTTICILWLIFTPSAVFK